MTEHEYRPDDRVARRPHFSLHGHELRFLRSSRAAAVLDESQLAVWTAASDEPTVADLCENLGDGTADRIRELQAMRLLDVVPALPTDRARRRIVIVEPHSDDAVLSVGGLMWQWRDEVEFTVATVFSRSNYTSYFHSGAEFFDVDTVTELRRQESARLAAMVGGRHVPLGQAEATLRYADGNWASEWFLANRPAVYAGNTHSPSQDELVRTVSAIEAYLLSVEADEIWFNLGVGAHVDHRLTSAACRAVVAGHPELRSRCTVRMYQDAPYDAQFPGHLDSIVAALRAHSADLDVSHHPIADVFDTKIELVSIFASQFKADALRADLLACGTSNGTRPAPVESLWELRALPTPVSPDELAHDRAEVDRCREELAAISTRLSAARTVRILMLVPSGRWDADVDALLSTWPSTRLEVHASPAARAEIERSPRERVVVRPVGQGTRPWAVLALRLAVASATPTVFVAGAQRRRAEQLAALWPRFPHIVVTSLDHLVSALGGRSQG